MGRADQQGEGPTPKRAPNGGPPAVFDSERKDWKQRGDSQTEPRPAAEDEFVLVKRWHDEARRLRAGHSMAATRYQFWGRALGALSAAFTAFVGGSLFTTWTAEANTSASLKFIMATASVTSSVLVVIITSLGFSAKSEHHHKASATFSPIVHELEGLRAASHADKEWPAVLRKLMLDLNNAFSDTPILPGRFFNKADRWVKKFPLDLWDDVLPSASRNQDRDHPPERRGLRRRLGRALHRRT